MNIQVVRDGDYVRIESPFWQVMHDVKRGGCITDIRITHGRNANLLRSPVSAAVDDRFFEHHNAQPDCAVRTTGGRITVVFSGSMRDREGREGGFFYEHRYIYSLYSLRNELKLVPSGNASVRTLTACAAELDGSLDEYTWGSSDYSKINSRYLEQIGPHFDDAWGRFDGAKKRLFSEQRRPWQVSVFAKGKEGIAWVGDSKQYAWDTPITGQKRAEFSLEQLGDRSRICLSPLSTGDGQRAVPMNQPLEFAWYWILPNVRAHNRRKLFPAFFGSNPFPCEGEIRAMAESGVNVISTMDDVDYKNKTVNHWHDGEFPPYPPAKMKELSRFLKQCHAHDIAVIPYFAGRILSTETAAFGKHARDWYASAIPEGQLRYHPAAMAGSQGLFVCADSGWVQYLERYIKRCVDELGFDGYYFDYCTPGACFNAKHLPGEHTMADGLTRLVENLRDWLGNDRLMIGHCGGNASWLMLHNIADGIVTLEEGKRDGGMFRRLEEYPSSIPFMGSGSVSLVPNVYFGRPQFNDQALLLHEGIAHAALMDTVIYPYTFWYEVFGYKNWKEAFADADGIYALYRRLKAIDFTQYKYFGPVSGVAMANRRSVKTAAYVGARDVIVVAGNVGQRPVANVTVRIRIPGEAGVIEKTVALGALKKSGVTLRRIRISRGGR